MTTAAYKLVSLALIDEPDLAMRSDIPDGGIRELAEDIKRNGLTNAICIRARNGRYYIIAGHRRYLAFKLLLRDEIDCKDYTGSPHSDEAIKFGENFYRTDVDDADMAVYLADLREKYNYGEEQLMAITGQSADWVAKRLSLFKGDKAVFDALKAGAINLGHALILNRFPERYRAQHLQIVVNSTPPVRVVEGWLRDLKAAGLPEGPIEPGGAPVEDAATTVGVSAEPCCLCDGDQRPWDMEYKRTHKDCLRSIKKAMAGEPS